MSEFYLPTGLPIPVPEPSGLSKPFWDGLRNETIMVQRNARTGVYKDAAAALEPMVTGGNFDPLVVESLYFSWMRTGEYTKARDKFEAWANANPNAGAIHLAAGRSPSTLLWSDSAAAQTPAAEVFCYSGR